MPVGAKLAASVLSTLEKPGQKSKPKGEHLFTLLMT
jgi:hypothetical protein